MSHQPPQLHGSPECTSAPTRDLAATAGRADLLARSAASARWRRRELLPTGGSCARTAADARHERNRASKELVGVGDQMKMAREHALLGNYEGRLL